MRKKISRVCAGYHVRCVVSAVTRKSLSLWLYFYTTSAVRNCVSEKLRKPATTTTVEKALIFPFHFLSLSPPSSTRTVLSYTHTHSPSLIIDFDDDDIVGE
jgi:hypothetical protein